MTLFLSRARRYLVDLLWHHLVWGTACHLRGRHLSLAPVANVSKKGGFLPQPLHQCRRCHQFWINESNGARFGGRRG